MVCASIYSSALRGRPAQILTKELQLHNLLESSFDLVKGFTLRSYLLDVKGQRELFLSLMQVVQQVTTMCQLHRTMLRAKLLSLLVSFTTMLCFPLIYADLFLSCCSVLWH